MREHRLALVPGCPLREMSIIERLHCMSCDIVAIGCLQLFVISVTMLCELYDDVKRFVRDRSVNNEKYTKITSNGMYNYY